MADVATQRTPKKSPDKSRFGATEGGSPLNKAKKQVPQQDDVSNGQEEAESQIEESEDGQTEAAEEVGTQ